LERGKIEKNGGPVGAKGKKACRLQGYEEEMARTGPIPSEKREAPSRPAKKNENAYVPKR